MSQLKYAVVLLVAALCLVTGQDLASLPACGRTCVTDMSETQAGSLGCAADAFSCLCANANFHNGINDCANQNCGTDVAPTVTNYVVAFCATATVAPATPAPTSSPAAPETTEAPTEAPSPTSAPEEPASSTPPPAAESTTPVSSAAESPAASSTVSPEPSSSPTPVQSPQSSTTLVTSTSPTPTPSTTRKTTASSSSTSSSTSSASATAAAADANSPSSSSGSKLSMGAIVGICIAVAVVLLVGIVFFMLRRHRARMHKRKSVAFLNQLKISDPMPGSGRTYAEAYHSPQYPDEPASELEMRSRRYEDMVPRVAPKLIS